jgi:SAM domain (Sterile alpha motif)
VDVGRWLQSLGLERYEAAFRENDVNEEDLPHLTAEDLQDLGVGAVGHRRRLLVAIAMLRDDAVPVQPARVPGDRPASIL